MYILYKKSTSAFKFINSRRQKNIGKKILILPISNIPNIIEYSYTIPKVYIDASGYTTVQKDIYTITTYDSNGNLKTVTNRTTIDIVIWQ